MTVPFKKEEVGKAVKILENNKSAGSDNIVAEQLKNSQEIVHERIASLLNEISRSGKFPKEINQEILIPLPKPGKKEGTCWKSKTNNFVIYAKKNSCYLHVKKSDWKSW